LGWRVCARRFGGLPLFFLIVAWLGSGFDYAVALYANWDWGRNFPHLKRDCFRFERKGTLCSLSKLNN
jgi:hypothetical protein